jgi:hypothetical protein
MMLQHNSWRRPDDRCTGLPLFLCNEFATSNIRRISRHAAQMVLLATNRLGLPPVRTLTMIPTIGSQCGRYKRILAKPR